MVTPTGRISTPGPTLTCVTITTTDPSSVYFSPTPSPRVPYPYVSCHHHGSRPYVRVDTVVHHDQRPHVRSHLVTTTTSDPVPVRSSSPLSWTPTYNLRSRLNYPFLPRKRLVTTDFPRSHRSLGEEKRVPLFSTGYLRKNRSWTRSDRLHHYSLLRRLCKNTTVEF